MAIISKNIKRLGDSAPFNNKSQRESIFNTQRRTKKNALRLRKPEGMNYKDVDLTYKEPYSFEFQKQQDRVDHIEANKELEFEYKNRLELANYSSFKTDDMPNFDISKVEERDAVSFYEPLAR